MSAGKPGTVMGEILRRLIRYTGTRFTDEERILARHGYPALASLEREHAAFVRRVAEFQQGFQAGRVTVSLDMLEFLKDWLVKHIRGSDRAHGDFLTAKGVR
jgi:hemerythrin